MTTGSASPRRFSLWLIYLLLAPLALARRLRRRSGWITEPRGR